MGVTPLDLSVCTAASRSSQLAGAGMPASESTFLLLNSRTGCVPRIGMPYDLPPITAVLKTEGRKSLLRAGSLAIRESSGISRPALTNGWMLPPPQLKKTSGACGVVMTVWSFCW